MNIILVGSQTPNKPGSNPQAEERSTQTRFLRTTHAQADRLLSVTLKITAALLSSLEKLVQDVHVVLWATLKYPFPK